MMFAACAVDPSPPGVVVHGVGHGGGSRRDVLLKLLFVRWLNFHCPRVKLRVAALLGLVSTTTPTSNLQLASDTTTISIETMSGAVLTSITVNHNHATTATAETAATLTVHDVKEAIVQQLPEEVLGNVRLFADRGSDDELLDASPLPPDVRRLFMVRATALQVFFGSTGGHSWKNTKKIRYGLRGPGKRGWGNLEKPINTWAGLKTMGGTLRLMALPYNNLHGRLPRTVWSAWPVLAVLSLPHNKLTGCIPSEIGHCHELHTLNLAHNQLTGAIPAELARCSGLIQVNLADNELAIPEGFPVEEDYGEPFYYGRQACAELLRVLGSGTAGV